MVEFLRGINWSQGLWRLWIAISALWVVIAFFNSNPIAAIEHRSDSFVLTYNGQGVEFPGEIAYPVMRGALIRLGKEQNAALKSKPIDPSSVVPAPIDPVAEADNALLGYKPPESIFNILLRSFSLMLIPPLIVLGIAFTIRWIALGFMSKKPAQIDFSPEGS